MSVAIGHRIDEARSLAPRFSAADIDGATRLSGASQGCFLAAGDPRNGQSALE
jgi:hypothetical protein